MANSGEGKSAPEVLYSKGEAEDRPWGRWEVLETGPCFAVKRITVKPGAGLSLQYHHHRAEHWIVVSGTAQVTRGEEIFDLAANGATFIPVGTKHRIENHGAEPVVFIEVQYGEILDEADIVRLEDSYGRV